MSLTTSERVALQRAAGTEGVAPSGWLQPGAGSRGRRRRRPGRARRPVGGWGRRGLRDLALGLVLPVVLLVLWQVLVTAEVLDPSRFSSPAALGAGSSPRWSRAGCGRTWPSAPSGCSSASPSARCSPSSPASSWR